MKTIGQTLLLNNVEWNQEFKAICRRLSEMCSEQECSTCDLWERADEECLLALWGAPSNWSDASMLD